MAKKRKSRKQQMIEKKNKEEEKRMLYWAIGITLVFLVLAFIYFENELLYTFQLPCQKSNSASKINMKLNLDLKVASSQEWLDYGNELCSQIPRPQ